MHGVIHIASEMSDKGPLSMDCVKGLVRYDLVMTHSIRAYTEGPE
jgi:hypothetical protein